MVSRVSRILSLFFILRFCHIPSSTTSRRSRRRRRRGGESRAGVPEFDPHVPGLICNPCARSVTHVPGLGTLDVDRRPLRKHAALLSREQQRATCARPCAAMPVRHRPRSGPEKASLRADRLKRRPGKGFRRWLGTCRGESHSAAATAIRATRARSAAATSSASCASAGSRLRRQSRHTGSGLPGRSSSDHATSGPGSAGRVQPKHSRPMESGSTLR